MLFRKKIPRSCSTCQHSAVFDDEQFICIKRGVVENTFSCRKFRYDPCKRIPAKSKALNFSRYLEEDFSL